MSDAGAFPPAGDLPPPGEPPPVQWGAPQPPPYGAYPAPYPSYPAPGYPPTQGYPPTPGYPPGPGYPAYPVDPRANGTSAYAVLALVFGVIPVLMGALGVIFGVVALHRIRTLGHQGRGLAITGIVLGWLWLAVLTLITAAALVEAA